jgi:hypothetical protein
LLRVAAVGLFSRKPAPPAVPALPAPFAEEVANLRVEVKALRRDLDDLDETFRSWRGRVSKQKGLDEASEKAAPADGAAPAGRPNGRPSTVGQLKLAGRWPF